MNCTSRRSGLFLARGILNPSFLYPGLLHSRLGLLPCVLHGQR